LTTTDLTKIERSVFIRAPRARVWRAIANVEEFAAWFNVKAEGVFAPNATVRMTCLHPGYENIRFDVNIESIEPEHRLAWRWHPGSEAPPAGELPTLVEFFLTEEDAGTRVTVIESGFDRVSLARRAKALEENTQGWEEQMKALQRYLGDVR
jgi:uncharacterized protein YndB with AHSA1/START domain